MQHFSRIRTLVIAALCVQFLTAPASILLSQIFAQTPAWRTVGNLREARNYFEAQVISQSEALVMGGYVNGTHPLNGTPSKACEIINLEQSVILPAAPMSVAHAETVSLVANDSSIVILSGMSNNGRLTAICEAYSPRTHSWRVLGELLLPRRQHQAVFINPDEILVAGGRIENLDVVADCEIFNIRTGKSRIIAPLPMGVCIGAAGISSNGDILVIGGNGRGLGSQHSGFTFKFHPIQETWTTVGALPETLSATTLLRASNGELLLFYGHNGDDARGWLASNSVYRESNSIFRTIATSPVPRYWTCGAAWNQDSLIVVGGFESASFSPNPLPYTEWFNTRMNTLSAGPRLNTGRAYAKALSLPRTDRCTGEIVPRVVAISGFDSWSSASSGVEVLERGVTSPVGKSRPYSPLVAFPTPAHSTVQVVLSKKLDNNNIRNTESYSFSLMSAQGHVIRRGAITLTVQGVEQSTFMGAIDVADIPSGVYVLTLSDIGPCSAVPIVVVH